MPDQLPAAHSQNPPPLNDIRHKEEGEYKEKNSYELLKMKKARKTPVSSENLDNAEKKTLLQATV